MKHLSWFGSLLAAPWLLLGLTSFAASQAPPAESGTESADVSAASQSPKYGVLEDRLTLREPFNQAKDKTRVIAFLSPSCDRCRKNAGELQREVLAKNKTDDLEVFIVWLKVLQKDDEAAVAEAMQKISDPRVHHFWDPERVLNAQLLDAIMFDVKLRLYDIFLLYDGAALWEKRLPRPGYWMHEYKGAPGPWWDITTFAAEVEKGLQGEAFTSPVQ